MALRRDLKLMAVFCCFNLWSVPGWIVWVWWWFLLFL